ncbi:MAG: radical SAM protein [Candidatus Omnitrophota bacterium]
MKVVLIKPPEKNKLWVGIPRFLNEDIFLFPPLGLMYLKAYAERNTHHKVILHDSLVYKTGYAGVAEFVRDVAPRVVGISTFTHSLVDVLETARAVKAVMPDVHVSLGGSHTFSFSEESAGLINSGVVDSVMLGDGERSFCALINAIDLGLEPRGIEGIVYKSKNGGISGSREVVYENDLDAMPFPYRKEYGYRQYYSPATSGKLMTMMISSRGCPYGCKFCASQKKYRTRSAENIVDEIEWLVKEGFLEVFFLDETFNTSPERVILVSEEILRRGIKIIWGFRARCDNVTLEMLRVAKRAGCAKIHYGVETGTNEALEAINKKTTIREIQETFWNTKKSGIMTIAYFLLGCPNEKTGAVIRETVRFSTTLPADYAVFALFSPYPDTPYYKKGVEKGVIDRRPWDDFMRNPTWDHRIETLWTEHFSKEDLVSSLRGAHRQFYYRPGYVIRTLFKMRSLREFWRLLAGALSLIKLEIFRKIKGRI